jgi:hypothetical protein
MVASVTTVTLPEHEAEGLNTTLRRLVRIITIQMYSS